MSGMTTQQGWQCPVCRTVHAPWVASCFCHIQSKPITYITTGNPPSKPGVTVSTTGSAEEGDNGKM